MSDLPYLIDTPTTEVEVHRYDDDTITLSLCTEVTERVDLTPAQAATLGFTLLALSGRNKS